MRTETFETDRRVSLFKQIDLDLDRTKRVYKVLEKLSHNAMNQLKAGDLKGFSYSSDKMRPMLSYIADNEIFLSNHITETRIDEKLENELRSLSQNLKKNLNLVDNARQTLAQVEFNPVFFLSEDLTNAYIDNQLPLAWEFEHDLITIHNLENRFLIDLLIQRGQKRIFLLGGTIDVSQLNIEVPDTVIYKVEDETQIDDLVVAFPQRPPRRIVSLDCGNSPSSPEKMIYIKDLLTRGRSRAWLRFNTINRGDAVKILDNLANILVHRQTSEFHQKFKGVPAIIVCPGPSLKKNIAQLKKFKGRALIICVLHALKSLKSEGIVPDIVIHVDPQNLKKEKVNKKHDITLFDHWINKTDLRDVPYFVTSSTAPPDNFDIPVDEVLWMSPGMRIGEFLPIDLHDYTRVGGSVSHSAFDLAVEFGCSKIVLIGQDLALTDEGDAYFEKAILGKRTSRIGGLGEQFKVKGFYGKEVTTTSSYAFFAQFYKYFAVEVKELGISLFNCTEGGVFIEGFDHISLEDFYKNEIDAACPDNQVQDIFSEIKRDKSIFKKNKEKLERFTKDNIKLGKEVHRLSKSAIEIAKRQYYTDEDLRKFDKVQNKVIKKLTRNYFYTLGLQKEIYILKAGIAADPSIEGQIGFHLDFLKSVGNFNQKFVKAFKTQLPLITSNG